MRALLLAACMAPLLAATAEYVDDGDPTDDEQAFLELVNRARADPAGEGARLAASGDPGVLAAYDYFQVDLDLMQAEFAAMPAVAPLVMNARLLAAARGHAQWMLDHDLQSHNQGSVTPGQRVTAQGYSWTTVGENIYAYAEGVGYGHAGFEVDWGGSAASGGMQAPRGHRANIHAAAFREIGIGVLAPSHLTGSVGPMLVTQDFASRSGLGPFLTGVVYTDDDQDGAYTAGEGRGGIRVDVTGLPGTAGPDWHAVTGQAGGWAVPVPGDGGYQVRFTHLSTGAVLATRTATVAGAQNRKVDFAWDVALSDQTPPATPSAPSLSGGADGRPVLSGLTEAAAVITIRNGDVVLATVVADGSGDWRWQPAVPLPDGAYLFRVTSTDWSGNTSAVSPAAVLLIGTGGDGDGSGTADGGGGGGCGAGALGGLLLALHGLRRRR